MALKAVYSSQEEIPEAHRELFSEKGGKWEIQVEGMKTEADIERLQVGLEKERNEHKATKEKLRPFQGLDPEDVRTKLETLASTKSVDENKINELVEARIKTRIAPLERENQELKTKTQEQEGIIGDFKSKETKRTVTDTVRDAASKLKVRQEALDDVLLWGQNVFKVTEDGKVATEDGLTPDLWLADMQQKRPHWWPESSGGGAGGSGGGGSFAENPFSAEHWNMTKQGEMLRENREKAEKYAKAAGTTIGGPKPKTKAA